MAVSFNPDAARAAGWISQGAEYGEPDTWYYSPNRYIEVGVTPTASIDQLMWNYGFRSGDFGFTDQPATRAYGVSPYPDEPGFPTSAPLVDVPAVSAQQQAVQYLTDMVHHMGSWNSDPQVAINAWNSSPELQGLLSRDQLNSMVIQPAVQRAQNQAQSDASISNGFDIGSLLVPAMAGGIGLLSGGFGVGSLFNGGGSGGGMWDWLGNFFNGNSITPTQQMSMFDADMGGLNSLTQADANSMYKALGITPNVTSPFGDIYGGSQSILNNAGSLSNILRSATGGSLFGNSGSLFGNGNSSMGGLLGAGLGALLGGLGESKQIGTATNTTTSGMNPTLTGPSVNQLLSTIRGDYLNPASNPYLQDTYNMAAKSLTDNYSMATAPQTSFLFGKGGQAFGDNSGFQQVQAKNQWDLGNNLQNLATNIYGQNYQNERGRQLAASTPFSGTSTINTTPIYANKLGGIMSGAMGGGILGSKLFG